MKAEKHVSVKVNKQKAQEAWILNGLHKISNYIYNKTKIVSIFWCAIK